MASDALPVYSAEDTIGGIQGLLSESLEEWAGNQNGNSAETVANEHFQQSHRQGLHLPITRYPTSLLSPAAVFHRPEGSQPPSTTTAESNTAQPTTNTSVTQLTLPINIEEDLAAQQAQRDGDILQAEIILSFHDAVRAKNIEVVTHLVTSGVCSPDVTDELGTTPLIAAVEAGDVNMVRCLLQLGAQINALAAYDENSHPGPTTTTTNPNPTNSISQIRRQNRRQRHYTQRTLPLRTPLMVAAQLGNLVIVKLLLSPSSSPPPEYTLSSPSSPSSPSDSPGYPLPTEPTSNPYPSADDAIISPTDGQIALRLAALHNHKEIVRILPSRRVGGYQRWKHSHAKSLHNIRRAGRKIAIALFVVFYETPRFFLWSLPKFLVFSPIWYTAKYCWKNKDKFGGWCQRQAKKFPERCVRVAKGVGRVTRKLGNKILKLPEYVKRVGAWIWGKIKQIPPAIRIGYLWCIASLKSLGKGLVDILSRFLSVMHTALMAVLDFFRNVTVKDVLAGFTTLLHAIFVDFPKMFYEKVIIDGSKTAWEMIKRVFGTIGEVFVWIGVLIVRGLVYIPVQLGKIVLWMGRSLKKGVDEVGVWVDPKRV